MPTLTPRETDVLRIVRDYRHDTGCAPTMQDIADQLGITKVSVFSHIDALDRKGVIRRTRKVRSIEIVDESALPVRAKRCVFPFLGEVK